MRTDRQLHTNQSAPRHLFDEFIHNYVVDMSKDVHTLQIEYISNVQKFVSVKPEQRL